MKKVFLLEVDQELLLEDLLERFLVLGFLNLLAAAEFVAEGPPTFFLFLADGLSASFVLTR